MATLYTHYDSNTRRTWVLMAAFFIAVIFLGWAFSWIFNNSIILYVAVFLSIAMNVGSYYYSDKLVLKMTGAHEASEKEYRELHTLVENLAITAGLPKPKVFVMKETAPNAFATGRNKEHAVVAVTEGLLTLLERTELEGVIAHELSHIGNRDMLVSTIAVTLVGFVTLLSDFFLRWSLFGGGGGDRDGRIQIIMTLVGVVLAILAPLVALLIQLAISRKREFLADASGALLTRYPEGLASALSKIGKYSAEMKRANHATAHLFLANPFGSKKERGIHRWFMTHPPVSERISALRGER
ncbi:MAG: M48 family metallopeptidase [Candidatus Paceibacterota bacterium]